MAAVESHPRAKICGGCSEELRTSAKRTPLRNSIRRLTSSTVLLPAFVAVFAAGGLLPLSVLGANVANADKAEIITVIGIYTHAWFLSFALGLPPIVLALEFLGIRRRNPDYMKAAERTSRIWGISFAAGAATGTLVEFGLVQIWSGSLIALGTFFFAPLFIEVFAFMLELVLLVLYLFTWSTYRYTWKHWMFGLFIAVGSIWSAYQILAANAWMNIPWGTGDLVSKVLPWVPTLGPNVTNSTAMIRVLNLLPSNGSAVIGNLNVMQSIGQILTNPLIAFSNPEAVPLFLHTVTASIAMIGFLASMFLSVKYFRKRGKREYYAKFLKVTFGIAAVASLIQPLFGDMGGRLEYTYMYTKFLALEGIPPQGGANPILGLLLFNNPNHFFQGFDYLRTLVGSSISPGLASYTIDFAQQNQPWLTTFFYVMVVSSIIMFIFSIVYFGLYSKKLNRLVRLVFRRDTQDVLFASSLVLPFLAILASVFGWVAREMGRHPWSIYGLITYNEIVTPVNLTWGYIALIVFIELLLGVGGTVAMYISFQWKASDEKNLLFEKSGDAQQLVKD
jgi:cytochrome d ubiquinol oxidase subunit I